MKALVLVVLLTLFVLLLVIGPANGYEWIQCPINGHWYTTIDGFPWEEAESNAVALGGHLVTIRSAEENQWILTNVVQPATSAPVWIGLYQISGSQEPVEGWVWSSGESVVYTHWSPGEPNQYEGLQEDWAEMYSLDTPRGYWNDVNLTMTRAKLGIVEVIPEPASILALIAGGAGIAVFRRRR